MNRPGESSGGFFMKYLALFLACLTMAGCQGFRLGGGPEAKPDPKDPGSQALIEAGVQWVEWGAILFALCLFATIVVWRVVPGISTKLTMAGSAFGLVLMAAGYAVARWGGRVVDVALVFTAAALIAVAIPVLPPAWRRFRTWVRRHLGDKKGAPA